MARPSLYTEELADKICHQIATSSKGLHSICKADDMPSTVTVYSWLKDENHKEFLNKYVRAREDQADFLADEILQIADDSSKDTIEHEKFGEIENKEWVNRSKLRVDARKWVASKLKPKKYGDKMDLTTDGEKLQAATYQIGFNKNEESPD